LKAVELRGPHLVLADARGDDGIALGELVEGGTASCGMMCLLFFVAERMIAFPRGDLARATPRYPEA
jgi:hypothetical protein